MALGIGSNNPIYNIARILAGKTIDRVIDVNPMTNEFTIVFDDKTCLEIKEQNSATVIDVNYVD